MAEEVSGLAQLCRSIRDGDETGIASHLKQMAATNRPFLVALDELSQAEMAAGNTAHGVRLLQVLERLIPDNPFVLVRRIEGQIVAGVPEAAAELVRSAAKLTNEGLLFHAIELLTSNGFIDEAEALTRASGAAYPHPAGVLAACRARVLFARGRLRQALKEVTVLSSENAAHPIAMRYRQTLLEYLLDFAGMDAVGHEITLRWGEGFDLTRTVERLLFTFEHTKAQALLQNFARHHPQHAELVKSLTARLQAENTELNAAIAEHGPLAVSNPDTIHAALSQSGASPSRIRWGKASLSAFLRTDGMTEAQFKRFDWFLPNWEDASVRHRVLAAARRVCPASIAVRQRWLSYLMMLGAYADAAVECHEQLGDGLGGDTLFQAVVLLRLQAGGTVSSFMDAALFDTLRQRLLAQAQRAEPGFISVVYDHLVALGWTPPPLSPALLKPFEAEAAYTQRRLLAVTTGRLDRISATPHSSTPPPVRAVVALSGQLRGFETAWPTIYEKVCRPIDASVVISIWDKSVNAMGRHARRLERMLPDDVVARLQPEERYTDTFAVAYPETAKLLFDQTDVSAVAVHAQAAASGCDLLTVETESESLIEAIMPPFISGNMLKMYYKFARLEALLREHEVHNGEVFSHVVWVRPDCEVTRLLPRDLHACLAQPEIAWSSFVTENAFGDYLMILPRRAFAAIASIFSRACLSGDTRLLPWRPGRPDAVPGAGSLGAFGGPDVLFDILLAAGYMPYHRIPRISVRLLGRTPGHTAVRKSFEREQAVNQPSHAMR